jgi:ribosome biogenesis protein Nip4
MQSSVNWSVHVGSDPTKKNLRDKLLKFRLDIFLIAKIKINCIYTIPFIEIMFFFLKDALKQISLYIRLSVIEV